MTTTHAPVTTAVPVLPAAAATVAVTVACTALGTLVGPGSEEHGWGELLVVSGFGLVAVALVWGLAVTRLQDSAKAGPVGVGLAVAGLLSIAAFWAGVTPALAVGGILLGLAARRGGRAGSASAAVAIGALALVAYVAIYVSDLAARM